MPPFSTAALPGPLRTRLDRAIAELSMPSDIPTVDFSRPAGELALAAPDSVSWRVFKNPVSLFIGGVTAVLLELAEPRVRSGVWDHTRFRTEPLPRLKRTGLAAMMTVYGPRSAAETMIAGVVRRHGRVTGETPVGQTYRADDPELLDWVQATASFGFMEAYHAFVRPLSDAERDAFYAETEPAGRLYGATGAPRSVAEQVAQFEVMRPRLEPSEIVLEFLAIMRRTAILPGPLRGLQGLFIRAAVEILPAWTRERLGLGPAYGLKRWQAALVRTAGRMANRIVIESSPASQACLRLGLPADYLYRRDGAA